MLEALKEAEDRHVHQLWWPILSPGPSGGRWLLKGRMPLSWKGSLSTRQKEEELVLQHR